MTKDFVQLDRFKQWGNLTYLLYIIFAVRYRLNIGNSIPVRQFLSVLVR